MISLTKRISIYLKLGDCPEQYLGWLLMTF